MGQGLSDNTMPVEKKDQGHSANRTSVGFEVRDDFTLFTFIRGKKLEDAVNLLASGANPNIKDDKGDWAIHVATRTGDVNFVKLLIVFDANLAATDGQGLTPLKVADSNTQWSDCAKTIKTVLDLQAEITPPSVENVRRAGAKPSGDDIYLLTLDGGGIKGLVFIQVLLGIEKRRKLLYPRTPNHLFLISIGSVGPALVLWLPLRSLAWTFRIPFSKGEACT